MLENKKVSARIDHHLQTYPGFPVDSWFQKERLDVGVPRKVEIELSNRNFRIGEEHNDTFAGQITDDTDKVYIFKMKPLPK
jgi:hypothetical protein